MKTPLGLLLVVCWLVGGCQDGQPPARTRGAALITTTPYLVQDINPGEFFDLYSFVPPRGFTAIGSTTFFAADDGKSSGHELWKTDGTAAGTALVSDVLPGRDSSALSFLSAMNGRLYFAAETAASPWAPGALWTSDGTPAGTRVVAAFGDRPSFVTEHAGTLYFEAPTPGANGFELWKSDGTAAGTVRIKAVPGSERSGYETFAWVGDTLFFSVFDPAQGHVLWKSDGTEAGTVFVKDVQPSTDRYDPLSSFTAVNGTLLFETYGVTDWRIELWRSDGTDSGTYSLRPLQNAWGTSEWSKLTVAGNVAYLRQWTDVAGLELWKTDGTVAGTVQVADILPGSSDSSPTDFAARGTAVYFFAKAPPGRWQLFRSDGTPSGTVPLTSFDGSSWYLNGEYGTPIAAGADAVYFTASNFTSEQLWKTDGTAGGTVPVTTSASLGYGDPTFHGWFGALYFTTSDGRLWKSDGTEAGTAPLVSIAQRQKGAQLREGANLGGALAFASTLEGGAQLAISDGTAAGTFGLSPPGSFVKLFPADGQLFAWTRGYYFSSEADFFSLYSADGTSGGSTSLRSQVEDKVYSEPERVPSSAALGRTLFFASDPSSTSESAALWKSDGTAPGTVKVTELRYGSPGFYFILAPRLLTATSDRLFLAGTLFTTDTLWISDGTAAGTQMIKELTSRSSYAPAIRHITSVGPTAYFWADTQPGGWALWKSDGTAAGTTVLAPLGASDAVVPSATSTGTLSGALYFATSPAAELPQLWKADGTSAVRLYTFSSVKGGPAPAYFTPLNGALVFWAHTTADGYELWRTDGTPAGTTRIKDINPGPASAVAAPGPFVSYGPNGPLVFAASDGVSGLELWETDGTAAGTVQVADLVPGPASSSPMPLAGAGAQVFFEAWTPSTGRELWALPRPVTDTQPPQVTCPPAQVAEATSAYGAPVVYPPASATDPGGPSPVLRYSSRSGGYFDMGTTAVTVTAVDQAGNTATCSFNVTVRDSTPPTITCPAARNVEANRLGGAAVAYVPPATARDVASTPTLSYAPADQSVLPFGTTTVTATATDGAGLTATCTFNITVRDTTPPQVECPTGMRVEADRPGGALVAYDPPATAMDIASMPALSYVPASGSLLPQGTTTVSATATDGAGNTAGCTFPVTVQDTVPPSLTCPAMITAEATGPSGATVTFTLPAASDVASPPANVVALPGSGGVFSLGTWSVTVTAQDAADNQQRCTFPVSVVDTTPPTITCPAAQTVTATSRQGAAISWEPPRTADLVSTPEVSTSTASGDMFPVGSTVVTATARDAAGNAATCTFTLEVTLSEESPQGCGCQSGGAGSGMFGLGLLAMMGMRRRRRVQLPPRRRRLVRERTR